MKIPIRAPTVIKQHEEVMKRILEFIMANSIHVYTSMCTCDFSAISQPFRIVFPR